MTTAQKVIKYLAIAFALFLIVNIISCIFYGLYNFSSIFYTDNTNVSSKNTKSEVLTNVTSLEIDVNYATLSIVNSDEFKVETNNKYINIKQVGSKVEIKERGNGIFTRKEESNLVIYLPESIELDNVEIDVGAGSTNIEEINAKKFSFDIGAGRTIIDELNVSSKTELDGGAGKVEINSGVINNLDLDVGVGETIVTAQILGNSEIDSGVGSLKVNLLGSDTLALYKVKISKGLGDVKFMDQVANDGETYGNGTNYIFINGGVGSIKINSK